jgi:hypothetical protein
LNAFGQINTRIVPEVNITDYTLLLETELETELGGVACMQGELAGQHNPYETELESTLESTE